MADEYAQNCGRLLSGIRWLDESARGFAPGEFVLIDGAGPRFSFIISSLCAEAAGSDESLADPRARLIFVDGGNSFSVYGIADACKRKGIQAGDVLSRIVVARAFTAYQMAGIVCDALRAEVEASGARAVVVSRLVDLFLDEDVERHESLQMLKNCMRELRAIARERGVAVIVTNVGFSKISRQASVCRLMESSPDRVIRLDERTIDAMLMSQPRFEKYGRLAADAEDALAGGGAGDLRLREHPGECGVRLPGDGLAAPRWAERVFGRGGGGRGARRRSWQARPAGRSIVDTLEKYCG